MVKNAFRENRPCARVLKVTNNAGAVAVTVTRMGGFESPAIGTGDTRGSTVAFSETGGSFGSITTGAANKDGFDTKPRPDESMTVLLRMQSDPSPAHPAVSNTRDHVGQS